MSILFPASATPVDITDRDLLNFHKQRVTSYSETKRHVTEFLPKLEASTNEIAKFGEKVRYK